MIAEKIRSLIETKLNNNTNSKKFIVGSYAYVEDKEREFVYDIRNGYREVETNYIPCFLKFTVDYQAIPDQLNGSAKISVDFLVEAETQNVFDTDLESLDEIISKIVANHEDIVDGTTTYHSVWNMDGLIPMGLKLFNSKYYNLITTTIYIDFSDTNYYGNRYKYQIDSVDLYAYDGDIQRDNEEMYPHIIGNYEAKGGLETSAWTGTFIFYINSTNETFRDMISSDTYNMQTVYTYKEYKNGTLYKSYPVKIKNIGQPILLGEKQYMTITLIKSDETS